MLEIQFLSLIYSHSVEYRKKITENLELKPESTLIKPVNKINIIKMRSMFMRLLRSCVCAIPWRQNACDYCKPRTSAVGGSSQMLSSLDISCMLPFSVCCFLLLLFSEKNKISCQMLNLISFTERRRPGYKCRHNDNCQTIVLGPI